MKNSVIFDRKLKDIGTNNYCKGTSDIYVESWIYGKFCYLRSKIERYRLFFIYVRIIIVKEYWRFVLPIQKLNRTATFDRKLEDKFFLDIGSFIYVRVIIKRTSDLC